MKLHFPWDQRAGIYDRASTLAGIAFTLVAIGISLFVAGVSFGWFLGATGILLLAFVPKCRKCGKGPLQQRLLDDDSPFKYIWFANRLWPEHICSGCGANLSVKPTVPTDDR
jgi:ribosomal protein L40E